jgi:hypothetical protein
VVNRHTNQPLRVRTPERSGPFIDVPTDQLRAVENVLRANGISFWSDEWSISIDGQPALTVVNIKHGTDAVAVQRILDQVA